MGEAFQYFQGQTLSEITSVLNSFQSKAASLRMQIETQEKVYNQNFGQDIIRYQQALNERTNYWAKNTELELAQQRLVQIRESLQLNNLYKEGYKLLNEIGHYFYGTWNYSITLFGASTYTFQMPMEEFLKFSHATVEGFRLDSQTSILSQLSDIQANKNINVIKWNNNREDKYNNKSYRDYKYVIKKARNIIINGGGTAPSYNRGQMLEGYMEYGENIDNLKNLSVIKQLVSLASRRHLGISDFGALEDSILDVYDALREQTNTRGFWTGGDTKAEGQIKGANASVFQFSTIKNQLLKVENLFKDLDFSRLEEKVKNVRPEAENELRQKVQQALDSVTAGFAATKIGIGADNLNAEIRATVDALL